MGDIYGFGESESFTFSAWVNAPGDFGETSSYSVIADGEGYTGPRIDLKLVRDGEQLSIALADGDTVDSWTSQETVPDGTWGHLTMVVDRSTDQLRGYIDSEEVITEDISNFGGFSTTTEFRVGANPREQYGMYGKIDDVRVYDRALSDAEIQRIFNATKPDTINSSQNDKLTNGLLGMWSFDGPDLTSATATDVSGNGNDGRLKKGPQPSIGKIGQALEFDGDSEVRVKDSSSLLPPEITVCAWAKITGPGGSKNFQVIARKRDFAQDGFDLEYREDTDSLLWRVQDSGDTYGLTPSIDKNEWNYVCGTFDGSISEVFINGERKASTSASMGTDTTNDFQIGKAFVGIDGRIDNVRLYNRALSKGEVKRLYYIGR
jgi:hypothetical protein